VKFKLSLFNAPTKEDEEKLKMYEHQLKGANTDSDGEGCGGIDSLK